MAYGSKAVTVTFRGFPDGINSADPETKVGDAYRSQAPRFQCVSSIDAILDETNIRRRPGSLGIVRSATGVMNGLANYLQFDGSESLIKVSGGKIYSVGKIAPYSETLLYDMGGSGEAWFSTYLNKCFVCNGRQNVKIEGSTVHQLGIAAPTGVSAAAAAGGSLPDGVYQVYACYGRKVSGIIQLYSAGQDLGEITLGSGNNTINISAFVDSVDPQANCKVIFMSDAGGSTHYRYAQVDNPTTTISISDASTKNEAIIYGTVAVNNIVPAAFTYIYAFDNRIWGSIGQTLYYSLQAGTVYDLDRWQELNSIEYPYTITGIFSLGEHLYINTPAGIIRQPSGDVTARFQHVEKRYHFRYARTIAEWAGNIVGVSEDGVRLFDGNRMSDFDLSKDIKPEIGKLYAGASSDNQPCAAIVRRGDRSEYHLCYRDISISNDGNNRRLVMNLDKLQVLSNSAAITAWDKWRTGANYLAVDFAGDLYSGQSGTAANDNVVFKERSDRCVDENIYIDGEFKTAYVPQPEVVSGTFILGLSNRIQWRQIRALAQLAAEMVVEIHLLSYPSMSSSKTISPVTASVSRFSVARFGVDRFAPSTPAHRKVPLPRNLRGYAFYIVIKQVLEDKNFNLLQLELSGILSQTRYT